MENLLDETLMDLKKEGKTSKDVQFVISDSGILTWESFSKFADFEYDSGFGGYEIDITLKIVGKDWWLERHEYDGLEWWEYKTLPIKKEDMTEISTLMEN